MAEARTGRAELCPLEQSGVTCAEGIESRLAADWRLVGGIKGLGETGTAYRLDGSTP